jgi:hypothetical protein
MALWGKSMVRRLAFFGSEKTNPPPGPSVVEAVPV